MGVLHSSQNFWFLTKYHTHMHIFIFLCYYNVYIKLYQTHVNEKNLFQEFWLYFRTHNKQDDDIQIFIKYIVDHGSHYIKKGNSLINAKYH